MNDCRSCWDSPVPGVRFDVPRYDPSAPKPPAGFVAVGRCEWCGVYPNALKAAEASGRDAYPSDDRLVAFCRPPEGVRRWHEAASPGLPASDSAARPGGCRGCAHSPVPGVRPDAGDDESPPPGFVIVERCDECEAYPDDLAAAAAYGADARWVEDGESVYAVCRPPGAVLRRYRVTFERNVKCRQLAVVEVEGLDAADAGRRAAAAADAGGVAWSPPEPIAKPTASLAVGTEDL